MIICPQCRVENPAGSRSCKGCGVQFVIMPGAAPRPMANDPGMRLLLPVGRTGLAIAAGYLGLLAFIPFVAPLALIFGIWAMLDLKKRPEMHGMGRAIFAIVMGVLGSAVLAIILLS